MPDPSRADAVEYAETIHETHPDLAFDYSSSFAWSEQDDPLTFAELGNRRSAASTTGRRPRSASPSSSARRPSATERRSHCASSRFALPAARAF
jgi:hypothetical protein